MGVDRIARINELLRREIAEQLYRLATDGRLDMAAVTVTRVLASADLRQARVFISIAAEPARQRGFMDIIRRLRGDIQAAINRDVRMRYTPRLTFVLDESVAQGDAVLRMLSDLLPPDEPTS